VENARNGGARRCGPAVHARRRALARVNALGGGTRSCSPHPQSLDAADVWSTIQAESVNILLHRRDGFGRPLVDELERHDYDMSSMLMVVSGGSGAQLGCDEPDPRAAPERRRDGRARRVGDRSRPPRSAAPEPEPRPDVHAQRRHVLVSEDLSAVLSPTDRARWLAQQGRCRSAT